MTPHICYTIWFSQRVGSTLLCQLLASTGVAGSPGEWLDFSSIGALTDHYGTTDPIVLQEQIWNAGLVNDVFGLKFGPHQPYFGQLLQTLRSFPGAKPESTPQEVWRSAFPNSRNIFLTRNDKVELAISWWKAIQTENWHRRIGDASPKTVEDDLTYSFDAIDHLRNEAMEREALILEFIGGFTDCHLTLTYEDLVADPNETVRRVLRYLDVEAGGPIGRIGYEKLADEHSREWVKRFNAQQTKRLR